jgi:hypothetical protein
VDWTDDAKVKEVAHQLLSEIVKTVEFPPYVQQLESDGEFLFVCTLKSPNGDAVLHYKPRQAAEFLVRECAGWASVIRKRRELFPEDPGFEEEMFLISAKTTIQMLLINFHNEFGELVGALPRMAFEQLSFGAEAIGHAKVKGHDVKLDWQAAIQRMEETLAHFTRGRRERWLRTLNRAKNATEPALDLLSVFYDKVTLPAWKEAKDRYERNKDSKKWREIIKASCDDDSIPLPADLINRLDGCAEDTDAYVSMPSAIALEHAARLCGAAPNAYKTRTLYGHLAASRKWFEETPEMERLKRISVWLDHKYGAGWRDSLLDEDNEDTAEEPARVPQ